MCAGFYTCQLLALTNDEGIHKRNQVERGGGGEGWGEDEYVIYILIVNQLFNYVINDLINSALII